ncbi:hypothetical protein [Nocardia sp. NPDC002869]|uniref:hypothetical protein n=1 Tax=Nocardia sp. NPDC002869 TaxID=3161032 RepID=UPI00398CF211
MTAQLTAIADTLGRSPDPASRAAARHPDLVSALIIEDIGPVVREPEIAPFYRSVGGPPRPAPTPTWRTLCAPAARRECAGTKSESVRTSPPHG